jgi:hypothetical protein
MRREVINFSNIEKTLLTQVINFVHGEIKEKFENIFQLDVYPDIIINFDIDVKKPRQSLCWSNLGIKLGEDKNFISGLFFDNIVIEVVPIMTYFKVLNFEDLLSELGCAYLFKEFVRNLIIYELIKAHDLKFVYDRFAGESVFKPLSEIITPMVEEEKRLVYYIKLKDFYIEKLPKNILGKLICDLLFAITEHLDKHHNMRNIGIDPKVIFIVEEIVLQVRRDVG